MIDFFGFPDPNPDPKFSVVMDPEPPAFSCSSENVPRTNHAFLPFDHPAHYAWSPPSMGEKQVAGVMGLQLFQWFCVYKCIHIICM